MAYHDLALIIETPKATKKIRALISDDIYREFQEALIHNPQLGEQVEGTGGVRKARWNIEGAGKSGGIRVLYYWANWEGKFYILLVYPKGDQENFTPEQKKQLRKAVQGIKNG